jgi:hypothetical protein
MITVLKPEHLELFLELKREVPGSWKLGKVYDEIVNPKDYYLKTLMHEQYYTVGYIEDGKLISIASMIEFSDTPSWCLMYLCSKNTGYNTLVESKSNLLISELFEESLRRKLVAVIWMVRDKFPSFNSVMVRRWQKVVPQVDYYHWYRDSTIPANTKPKYSYQDWLMSYKQWPVDLKIDCLVLKQEYREKFIYEIN